MEEKIRKEIAAYVRDNVEDYEIRLRLTLKQMDKMRCPFWMADDGRLYDEIVDAISEWCEDNDISVEFDEDWEDLIEGDNGIIWEE